MATAEKTARKNLGDFGAPRVAAAIKSAPGKPLPTAMAALKDPVAVGMRVHGMSFRREMRAFDNHRAILDTIRNPPRCAA